MAEYTISEVSKRLDTTDNNLRYMEKCLNLVIPRDKLNNRVYTENIVKEIEEILSLKTSGHSFKAIKETLERKQKSIIISEKQTEIVNDVPKFVFYGEDFYNIVESINNSISQNICNKVGAQLENFQEGINVNFKELEKIIQGQVTKEDLDKHFREFDIKLNNIKEMNIQRHNEANKSFIKRLIGLFYKN